MGWSWHLAPTWGSLQATLVSDSAVQHHGDRLLLIEQPQASSCNLWALTSDVDLGSLKVQRTPVKDVMGLASPIRGFGEPPRHTSMLWLSKSDDGSHIFTWFTPFECWHLSDLEGMPSILDTLPAKYDSLVGMSSVAHAAEAAGQAIPLLMIRPAACWVASRMLQHTAFEGSGVHSEVPRLHLDSPVARRSKVPLLMLRCSRQSLWCSSCSNGLCLGTRKRQETPAKTPPSSLWYRNGCTSMYGGAG